MPVDYTLAGNETWRPVYGWSAYRVSSLGRVACVKDIDGDCAVRLLTPTAPRGESRHNARLTAEIVRQIRDRSAAGESQAGLRAQFGVGGGAMSSIVHRRSWVWLDGGGLANAD